jgi:surfactin synthase thioesterase subunit
MSETPNLICFHHAGGAASSFRLWRQHANAQLPVYAVQLPGRESKVGEPRLTDIDDVVENLLNELRPVLSGPHILFGHSMGGLIAYRLARRRIELGLLPPQALAVAGCAAPHLAAPSIVIDDVSDLQLAEHLCDINGMRPELLRRPEWLGPLLAVVKDDLRICYSHKYQPAPRLPFPIHAFAGDTDPLVSVDNVAAWQEHTSSDFRMTVVRGGHFLVTENNTELRDGVFALTGALVGAA